MSTSDTPYLIINSNSLSNFQGTVKTQRWYYKSKDIKVKSFVHVCENTKMCKFKMCSESALPLAVCMLACWYHPHALVCSALYALIPVLRILFYMSVGVSLYVVQGSHELTILLSNSR